MPHDMSRRRFMTAIAATPFLTQYHLLAAPEKRRYKIRDLQCMVLNGPRTYTLVKVTADDGSYGIAEAYGSPTVGTKEEILAMKQLLMGKDPLEIDTLYTHMGEGGKGLSGTRTDGSAHNL